MCNISSTQHIHRSPSARILCKDAHAALYCWRNFECDVFKFEPEPALLQLRARRHVDFVQGASQSVQVRDIKYFSVPTKLTLNFPHRYVANATQYMYAGVDRVPTLAYVFKRPVAAKRLANSAAIQKTDLSCRVQRDSYLRFVRLPQVSHGGCDWSASEI